MRQGRYRGRPECHPERRAPPVAVGSAWALQADSPAPSGRPSCPLLVPGGIKTASTAHASAIFPYQVDFLPDHLAHFSSSFASGGHENRPTSHGLPNFVRNQNPTLRRILKNFIPLRRRKIKLCAYYQMVRYQTSCARGGTGRGLAQASASLKH